MLTLFFRGALLYLALGPTVASVAQTKHLSISNRSVFIAQFIAPNSITDSPHIGNTEFRYGIDLSSHSLREERDNSQMELDGESSRATFSVRRKINANWIVAAEVPLWHHTAGFLDQAIDRWHSLTGLPEGERPLQPRDTLNFFYNDGTNVTQLTESQSGLGDIQLSAARLINSTAHRSNWLQFTVKLPTGDANKFTGSGATDLAIQLNHRRHGRWRARSVDWLTTVTAMHTGKSEHLIDRQYRHQFHFSSQWSWAWRHSVHPQIKLRWRSAAYDNEQPLLGKSSVGVDTGIQYQNRYGIWQLGISEDIKVDSNPDVTLYAHFTRR